MLYLLHQHGQPQGTTSADVDDFRAIGNPAFVEIEKFSNGPHPQRISVLQEYISKCPKVVRNRSREMIRGSREVREDQNYAPDAMEALPRLKHL